MLVFSCSFFFHSTNLLLDEGTCMAVWRLFLHCFSICWWLFLVHLGRGHGHVRLLVPCSHGCQVVFQRGGTGVMVAPRARVWSVVSSVLSSSGRTPIFSLVNWTETEVTTVGDELRGEGSGAQAALLLEDTSHFSKLLSWPRSSW